MPEPLENTDRIRIVERLGHVFWRAGEPLTVSASPAHAVSGACDNTGGAPLILTGLARIAVAQPFAGIQKPQRASTFAGVVA